MCELKYVILCGVHTYPTVYRVSTLGYIIRNIFIPV
jgi:hypothetical protein